MVYYIENEIIKVGASSFGAAFDSVFFKPTGEELLWQGNKNSWADKDITIFPIAGRLKDGFYVLDGKRYEMAIHGVACYSEFEPESIQKDEMVFTLHANDFTKTAFPFDFVLKVAYRILGARVTKNYEIFNNSPKDMPYGIGFHPGFIVNPDENNVIEFEKPQTVNVVETDESNVFVSGVRRGDRLSGLTVKKSLFRRDAVIFKDFEGGITLNRGNRIKIVFDLNSPPYLAFWSHKESGDYVCVEPWWSLPDENPPVRDFYDKKGMSRLGSGASAKYEISFVAEQAK